MEMLIPGLCGLVVIIGLVAVVMSRSNWSVPQMVLVGLILVSSVGFLYLSAREFVMAKNWNDEIEEIYRRDRPDRTRQNGRGIRLLIGNRATKEVRDRAKKHEVEVALAGRGRVWRQGDMVRTNPDTGEITVSVDDPVPHGIEPKSTLFVFEHADKEREENISANSLSPRPRKATSRSRWFLRWLCRRAN